MNRRNYDSTPPSEAPVTPDREQALALLQELVDVDWCIGYEMTEAMQVRIDDVRTRAAMLLDGHSAAISPAQAWQPIDEMGWVIERHFNSQLCYWTGKPESMIGVWSPKHEDALRFSRQTDANCVLTWHLGGIGNVVQHGWAPPVSVLPAKDDS